MVTKKQKQLADFKRRLNFLKAKRHRNSADLLTIWAIEQEIKRLEKEGKDKEDNAHR